MSLTNFPSSSVMDDAEFFDCLDEEFEYDSFYSSSSDTEEIPTVPESENLVERVFNLDLGPIEPNTFHKFTLSPEILSILNQYPKYKRPPTLPEEIAFGTEVFFYPPFPGMDLNERLQCLDDYFRYELPDVLRTYPTTLIDSDQSSVYPEEPLPGIFPVSPTLPHYTVLTKTQLSPTCDLININDAQLKTENHFENSLKPEWRFDIYVDFLKHLNESDFPFTNEQREFLMEINKRISWLRIRTCKENELRLKQEFEKLIDNMGEYNSYPVSSFRISRYVCLMIKELEFWVVRKPINLLICPTENSFFVDPASHFIDKLIENFPDSTEDALEQTFCEKRKEILIELTQIFLKTKFPFTFEQKSYLNQISEMVHTTNGNPDSVGERKFLKLWGDFLYSVTYNDEGPRDGISNTKKIKKEVKRLIESLHALRDKEIQLLSDYETPFLNSADLVFYTIDVLYVSFFPHYLLLRAKKSVNDVVTDLLS